MSLLPEDWTVADGVYEPREDSFLLARVLKEMDLEGKSVLDVGTGSGIQAYTAAERGATVTAVDVNTAALKCAKQNLEAHGYDLECVHSDLFNDVTGTFDVIVFNPPYVPGNDELGTDEERSWAGGDQGRETIDRFLDGFRPHLAGKGQVLLLQSSLNGVDETLTAFDAQGCTAEVADTEKIPWERLTVIRAVCQ